ncbi:MAG: galactose mutarotase [Puniceicoccales bacterium]|jgi:aldose 1-epimerase|nr:galactose mutarotase [Puniceicoccales bacterium]
MSSITRTPKNSGATTKGITTEQWGILPDGRQVSLFTIDTGCGLRTRITNYGAIIVSVETPDKNGTLADVALGFDNLDGYLHDTAGTYFGAIVGRVANRIANGCFTLDGKSYELAKNNTPAGIPCALHGGTTGFDKVLWDATPSTSPDKSRSELRLHYHSTSGEEGYPGNLDVTLTYVLYEKTLRLNFEATTDAPTPINISQHSYFNLAGAGVGNILGHRLLLAASRFTPVNAGLIPDGRLLPVKGTPLDFLQPHTIGDRINSPYEQITFGGGYDHNWVLDGTPGILHLAANVFEPQSGRGLEIHTTEPGIQFYSGNFLNGVKGKNGKTYNYRCGFALETQHFPDSPNKPSFPSVILRPGETFKSNTEFRFYAR